MGNAISDWGAVLRFCSDVPAVVPLTRARLGVEASKSSSARRFVASALPLESSKDVKKVSSSLAEGLKMLVPG